MTTEQTVQDVIRESLKQVDQSGSVSSILTVEMQEKIIPEFVKEWIEKKPWKHMYNAILVCAKFSPQALKLILGDRLEGGGKITASVFLKRPDQVTKYFDVYPFDILLYCLRTDLMIFDELRPKTDEIFIGTIAKMPETTKFREGVKEFVL